jgi:DNA-binding MarR family transcriptional regulator
MGSMARTKTRLANDAWEGLLTAHAVLLKEMRAADIWDEVSIREYDVLYTLSKCGGPLRQGELNQQVLLSQPALSRMVDRLAARRLIIRSADPVDGRGVLLSLTAEGAAVQRRIGAKHAVDVARIVSARLTRQELEDLERLLHKLSGHHPTVT